MLGKEQTMKKKRTKIPKARLDFNKWDKFKFAREMKIANKDASKLQREEIERIKRIRAIKNGTTN